MSGRVFGGEDVLRSDLLGNSGLGLAGDSFDARIVRKLVSPALGSESFERSYAQAKCGPQASFPQRQRGSMPTSNGGTISLF